MANMENQENLQAKVENNKQKIDAMINKIYPVGSIYMSVNATSPSALFGGTWQSIGSGRVLQGADAAHAAGSTIEAGLPNIKGSVTSDDVNYYWGAGTSASGAFENAHVGGSYISGASWGGSRGNGFNFDASRCSAIYGRSDTVQPPAFVVNIWVRIA